MPPQARPRRLDRAFFERDPEVVAPELLGKVLRRGNLAGRVVEVEAYRGSDDDASHAFKGKTQRNATMFGPPGCLYVYFTYGMHHCANVVCHVDGQAGAVLLRAVAPLEGLEEMARGRFGDSAASACSGAAAHLGRAVVGTKMGWQVHALCSGPAKLCQAFALDRDANGYDLVRGVEGVVLLDDGNDPPDIPASGPRIGLAKDCNARSKPWRWWVLGNKNVSRPKGMR
jgi:DNA-3-methyladenine glycosylase